MRGGNQNFKKGSSTIDDHVRQSDHILHQIGHIKQSVSPYLSNTKLEEGQREKWFQYLPNQNNNYASLSREGNRNDNYLQSLERRLQKLFKEEKEMLKERHYKNQHNEKNFESRNMRSATNYQIKEEKIWEGSYNIQKMDRKIRDLEQRYHKQDIGKKSALPHKANEEFIQPTKKHYRKDISFEKSQKQCKQKANIESYPPKNHIFLKQTVEQCISKEKNLEEQVKTLKQSVKDLRLSNQGIFKRISKKQQKKKHKQRTKDLLHNIIHRLQFINVQIRSVKKRTQKEGKISKIQKETSQIMEQFELLRLQYKHLQDEKVKFQKKQQQIERKLQLMVQQKIEQKC